MVSQLWRAVSFYRIFKYLKGVLEEIYFFQMESCIFLMNCSKKVICFNLNFVKFKSYKKQREYEEKNKFQNLYTWKYLYIGLYTP